MANLRKQHVWGVMSDRDFKSEHQSLQRQRRVLEPSLSERSTPYLDRAAELLRDLPALWERPRVTQEQRRYLAREAFEEIRIRDRKLVAVRPQPEYVPHFAYSLWKENQYLGGKCSSKDQCATTTPPPCHSEAFSRRISLPIHQQCPRTTRPFAPLRVADKRQAISIVAITLPLSSSLVLG